MDKVSIKKELGSLKYLRLTEFNTSSAKGRSDERYRVAVLSTLSNILSKGVGILVMALSVALTLPYLGAERFGVWMTIASFTGMLAFLDLGVGNALTNKVAEIATKNNKVLLSATISGGLGCLFILSCVISIGLVELVKILPWEILIKINDQGGYIEFRESAIVFAVLFGFYIFSSGLQRIFAGLQRSFESHLLSAFGSIIGLIALLVAVQNEAGIPILLVATFGVQIIASMFLLPLLNYRNQFRLAGIKKNISKEYRHVMHIGGLFFILQLGVMIGWGSDALLVSSILGAKEVAVFVIVQRLFQVATQPMGMLNAPLWAAYADAHVRGEKDFIKKTFKRSIIFTLIYTVSIVTILTIFGGAIVNLWTGGAVTTPFNLLFVYGIWAILEALGSALAMLLSGCGIMRAQVMMVISLCIMVVPIKIWLMLNYGLEAMILGFVTTYFLVNVLFYGYIFKEEIKYKCL